MRLVFCLFADDTGIFEPRGIFLQLIKERTNRDGSETGQLLSQLFDVLNTPIAQRPRRLDEDLAQFRYVNGDLFEERLPIPALIAIVTHQRLNCKLSVALLSAVRQACAYGTITPVTPPSSFDRNRKGCLPPFSM